MPVIQRTIADRFEFRTEIFDYVSYLHYDNGISIIDGIAIRAVDGNQHANISLKVSLTSGLNDYSEKLDITFGDISDAWVEEYAPLKLNPSRFSELESIQKGELVFSVYEGENQIGTFNESIDLYPLNTWRRSPNWGYDALLLSAFSNPGDPAVKSIVGKARSIKEKLKDPAGKNYSPTSAGYQGDENEVLAEARAIYEAIQSLDIEYSNPLPNFNIFGQPIRTPSEILETKSATCLDSTMLVASCLEAIGLHPLIFVVPGHAFVGVWKDEDGHLPMPVSNIGDAVGLLGSKIQIFETTTVCRATNTVSFEDAMVRNSVWLNPDHNVYNEDGILLPAGLVDVRLAKAGEFKIHTLPSVHKQSDGSVTIVHAPATKIEFNFTGTTSAPKVGLRDDKAPERVKIWKASLLDMTFNNPLLNRSRRSGSGCRLILPNGKLGEVEDLLQMPGSKLGLRAFIKPDNAGNFYIPQVGKFGLLSEENNDLATQNLTIHKSLSVFVENGRPAPLLRKLAASAKASVQETGVNNLYMTFGSLTWPRDPENESSDRITSPLFLLPITLTALGKDNFEISLDDTGEPAPNETLALKLAEFGINVPLLSNPEEDHAGFDIPGLIEHVRNQIHAVHKRTSWVIDEDATIGTFDFSNFHMWKDLNDNWSELSKVPLVKHLIETDGTTPFINKNQKGESATSQDLDNEFAKLPLPSDETQVRAVLKSLGGESFIIQGPPGTGKSQTITNLLARNLQEGKRVLFMSEKPAALAVVKSRLDEVGLGAFILDLHDKGTKPASIRNQLLSAMDIQPEVDRTGLNSASGDYDTAIRTLSKYPDRIHVLDSKFGESVYTTRERLLEIEGSKTVSLSRQFLSEMDKATFDEFLGSLRDLPDLGPSAKTYSTNSWSLALVPDNLLDLDKKDNVGSLAKSLQRLYSDIHANQTLAELFDTTASVEGFKYFEIFRQLTLPSVADLDLARSSASTIHRSGLKREVAELEKKLNANSYFSPRLENLDIEDTLSRLNIAKTAKLFRGKKLSAVAESFNHFSGETTTRENFEPVFAEMRKLISKVQELSHLVKQTVGLEGINEFNAFNVETYPNLLERLERLEQTLEVTNPEKNPYGANLSKALATGKQSELAVLSDFGTELSDLFEQIGASERSISKWIGGATLSSKLKEAIPAWVDSTLDGDPRDLTRWAKIVGLLKPLMDQGQTDAVDQILSGDLPYADVPKAIEQSYLELLFAKLLDDNDLTNFEGLSQDNRVKLLDESIRKIRSYNRGLIASEVVSNRKFDASSNVGVTGALRAELTKQKKQMPVRKLLRQYWNTVTQVTPIVAASPDSVARFMDIESAKFDIVVFDEASQIRVATAIGALGRAPQAIIVGDSKQMPPTANFTKADGSGELDFNENDQFSLNDQESILSMAEVSQINAVMLNWHYRSQDEILIAFSNKHIYEGMLSSFPSPRVGELPHAERGLRLESEPTDLYVSGAKRLSENDGETGDAGGANTNLGEAKRVVKAIQKYVKAAGSKPLSLGVITMNSQQRGLIERLLDALDDDKIQRLRNNEIDPQNYLFVRELEKVQGDERDVIFLSVGFGRTVPQGKMSMNFGPMSRNNSHRRLNVAVTRARQEMVVFNSFEINELNLEDGSSRGMKLLKKFLELADGSGKPSVVSNSPLTVRDRHRDDIAHALELEGFKVTQNLGLSNFRVDIAISDPSDESKCLVAVMLDGRGWRARATVSDRDILPANVLKANMNWPAVERVWLPMWLRDRDGEIARIKLAVEQAIAEREIREESRSTDAIKQPQTLEGESSVASVPNEYLADVRVSNNDNASAAGAKGSKQVTLGVNLDDVQHFVTLRDEVMVQDKSYIQYLNHPEIKKLLLNLVDQLTQVEGPVSSTRVVQFVAKCFGLSGVKAARAEEILGHIPTRDYKRDDEGFVYPKGLSPYQFNSWAKQNPGMGRALAEISLVEISNAMATLCRKTAGMETGELAKQVSLAFGVNKLSKLADKRMFDAENLGVKRGILVNHDGIVMASAN